MRARIVSSMLTFERVPGYLFEIDTGTRTALYYHVSDTSIERLSQSRPMVELSRFLLCCISFAKMLARQIFR